MGVIPISLSNEIGSLGLLERENATILNAALADVAKSITNAFRKGLEEEGISNASLYLCQNDGTLMSIEYTRKYPILTVACGPTNSIRGASFLSGKRNAVVLDVGGTTSDIDIGVLVNGFPRESSLPVPLVLVGGGSILIGSEIEGVSEIIRPDNFDVANALGSAIAQVSGQVDRIFTLSGTTREQVIESAKRMAKDEAVKAGADPDTVEIVEVEDVPLAYHPGNATRIKIKAAGNLKQ
jgi:N-methylhydantoinase A/oxoprolinase/acetone carboxylase beta subunit